MLILEQFQGMWLLQLLLESLTENTVFEHQLKSV